MKKRHILDTGLDGANETPLNDEGWNSIVSDLRRREMRGGSLKISDQEEHIKISDQEEHIKPRDKGTRSKHSFELTEDTNKELPHTRESVRSTFLGRVQKIALKQHEEATPNERVDEYHPSSRKMKQEETKAEMETHPNKHSSLLNNIEAYTHNCAVRQVQSNVRSMLRRSKHIHPRRSSSIKKGPSDTKQAARVAEAACTWEQVGLAFEEKRASQMVCNEEEKDWATKVVTAQEKVLQAKKRYASSLWGVHHAYASLNQVGEGKIRGMGGGRRYQPRLSVTNGLALRLQHPKL